MKKTIALLSVLLLVTGCGAAAESKGGGTPPGPVSGPGPAKASADFATVKSQVFAPRCVQCHAQYESYGGVQRELAAIRSAVETNRMPKTGGPLSKEQKDLLFAWIASGAPEKSEGSSETPAPVLEPKWESVSANIFVPKCQVCHNPNGQAKFLDLSTREALTAAGNREFGDGKKLLDPASPDESYLIEVVLDPEEPMPPTWSNIDRLNAEEVRVLKEWIRLNLP